MVLVGIAFSPALTRFAEQEGLLPADAEAARGRVLAGVSRRLAKTEEASVEPGGGGVIDNSHTTVQFVEPGRVAGDTGCNRYMGSIVNGRMPGELSFGPLAGTMMACPEEIMETEKRYMDLLSRVTRFSFHLGKLALTSVDEDGNVHLLLFEDSSTAP